MDERNSFAFGALVISSISLLLSIINYYKTFEPALNIEIQYKSEHNASTSSDKTTITEISFINPTNNKFSDLSILCAFYYNDRISELNLKLDCSEYFPQSTYLGPKDKISINIDFLNKLYVVENRRLSDNKQSKLPVNALSLSEWTISEIIFKYSYTFLFKNNFYYMQFKWNNLSKTWDSTKVNDIYSSSL